MIKNEPDTLSPSEKLDAVLWCFFEYKSMHRSIDISEELATHPNKKIRNYSWKREPDEILDKLIEDKMIRQEKTETIGTLHHLTFTGRAMIETGGYQALLYRQTLEKIKDRRNRFWTFWVAVFLALGTTVSAVYYGFEIWNFFHPAHYLK